MDRVVLGCTAAILVRALLLQEAASSTIRVEPGHGNTRGRLQVFHDGIWGTVCDDSFGNPDARVACRALGINSKYAVPWNFGPGSGSILLDDLACHGTEESLDDCLHNVWGDHECEHSEDTGVICTDDEVMVTPTNVPVLVSDGDQVNFTCLALGNMGRPFRYHWFSGIQHSTDCGDTRVHQRLPDTLIISNGSDLGSSTANIGVQCKYISER
ncbi:soluble scavenger receptor cysteine-rich domain-containing protein SSC5D-like [Haliotis rubra]|uniref:soluble scavenger receptor cysteine-rich domain-containing protein SSC5D-like n=1 Tax=Haliotis rubra TaxID=36100 RepID=UPI001EE52EC3|nr:soluble scavenger receptor cysteine-rich domain-containing protein SSC5D-like [Haliotis rubra]